MNRRTSLVWVVVGAVVAVVFIALQAVDASAPGLGGPVVVTPPATVSAVPTVSPSKTGRQEVVRQERVSPRAPAGDDDEEDDD